MTSVAPKSSAAVIALIHGEDGAYGISFSDFSGCISGGSSIDECLRRGRDALGFHIESMAELGEAMPGIRSLDTIRKETGLKDEMADAVIAAIDIEVPGRPVHVDVAIDEHLLASLDRVASERGKTRDALISRGARAVLAA